MNGSVVLFDEISLKKGLAYNSFFDFLEGFEYLGDMGRSAKLTNYGLVFYVRGLLYKWKMHFCYFLTAGPAKGSPISSLLVTVIQKLQNMKLYPRVTVCDQGANNRYALSKLGATSKNPKITINDREVFVCYDPPHLLKSLRNNFMNNDLIILVNGNRIS